MRELTYTKKVAEIISLGNFITLTKHQLNSITNSCNLNFYACPIRQFVTQNPDILHGSTAIVQGYFITPYAFTYNLTSLIMLCEKHKPGFVNQRNIYGDTLLDTFFNAYEVDASKIKYSTKIFHHLIMSGGYCRIHSRSDAVKSYITDILFKNINVEDSDYEFECSNFLQVKLIYNIVFQEDNLHFYKIVESMNHLSQIIYKPKQDKEQEARCQNFRVILGHCMKEIFEDFIKFDKKSGRFVIAECNIKQNIIQDILTLAGARNISPLYTFLQRISYNTSYYINNGICENSIIPSEQCTKVENFDALPLHNKANIEFFTGLIEDAECIWKTNATSFVNFRFLAENAIRTNNILLFDKIRTFKVEKAEKFYIAYHCIHAAVKKRDQKAYDIVKKSFRTVPIYHSLHFCAQSAIKENDVDTLKLLLSNRAIYLGHCFAYKLESLYESVSHPSYANYNPVISKMLDKYGCLTQRAQDYFAPPTALIFTLAVNIPSLITALYLDDYIHDAAIISCGELITTLIIKPSVAILCNAPTSLYLFNFQTQYESYLCAFTQASLNIFHSIRDRFTVQLEEKVDYSTTERFDF